MIKLCLIAWLEIIHHSCRHVSFSGNMSYKLSSLFNNSNCYPLNQPIIDLRRRGTGSDNTQHRCINSPRLIAHARCSPRSVWLQCVTAGQSSALLICFFSLASQTVTSPQRPWQLTHTTSHTLWTAVCSLHTHPHANHTEVRYTAGERTTDRHRENNIYSPHTHFHVISWWESRLL